MTGQRQAGFTLIEVVIAIMIMAVISLISWRAIDSVALTSRRLDQHTEEALALQRAFDQFERDIGARSPDLAESAAPAAPEAQAASDAQEAEPQPVLPQLLPEAIRVSGMKTPAPRIDIIRGAPGRPDARQRVVWERRGGNLIRAAGTPTALTPLPAPASVRPPSCWTNCWISACGPGPRDAAGWRCRRRASSPRRRWNW